MDLSERQKLCLSWYSRFFAVWDSVLIISHILPYRIQLINKGFINLNNSFIGNQRH